MLYAVSALLTAVICGPFFGGYLLYRDAVAVPEFSLTAGAFGIDGAAPRSVPQDGLLAVASTLVDGGWLVAGLTALSLFAAGVGYGRLARQLVPGAGTAGAAAAATLGIWNPFVAERLAQGHWSLLAGYAALGWAVCAVRDVAAQPTWRGWARLAGVFAAAGLTPTGSVLVLIVAATTAIAVRPGLRQAGLGLLCWLATASPWLVGAAFSSGAVSSGGAAAFALRGEPWLGTVGTALGLGGIWNVDAVPGSRTSPWALIATVALLAVVGAGAWRLLRRRDGDPTITALGVLAAVTAALVVLAATPPGLAALDVALTHLPGTGLLRDTQKYLALLVPFYAVAAAAAVVALRRLVPTGFAVTAVLALVVAPLPDLAWGVGGSIRTVAFPDDYARVAQVIGADRAGARGAVALWPSTQVRRLSWTGQTSLTPLPRILTAPVVVSGALSVDGQTVDAPTGRAAAVVEVLNAGGDPRRLADLGVGWVVTEESDPPARLVDAPVVFAGTHLRVYRIDGAAAWPGPGAGAWTAAIIAFAVWLSALIAGAATALVRRRRW